MYLFKDIHILPNYSDARPRGGPVHSLLDCLCLLPSDSSLLFLLHRSLGDGDFQTAFFRRLDPSRVKKCREWRRRGCQPGSRYPGSQICDPCVLVASGAVSLLEIDPEGPSFENVPTLLICSCSFMNPPSEVRPVVDMFDILTTF